MSRALNFALGIWYENGGLYNVKLEAFFMACKIIIIHLLFSLPFVLVFKNTSTSIEEDISFELKIPGLYIYLSVVHYLIGLVIMKRYYTIVSLLKPYKSTFIGHSLDVDDTGNITAREISQKIGSTHEAFTNDALQTENLVTALEESGMITVKYIGSLIFTLPFEIAFKDIITHFFFDENKILKLSRVDENVILFKKLSRRLGFLILPFIMNLVIYTFFNHLLTYSNNNGLLNSYNYSRTGRWKIRLYNEFDVDLRERLDRTFSHLENVISNHRTNTSKTILYKIASFLSGTISMILLWFTFYGYEKFYSVDVYTLIAIFAGFSALVYPRRNILDAEALPSLCGILKKQWEIAELDKLVENKAFILVKEIFSILLLPVLFFYWLPDHAYFICNFINTHVVDNYVMHSTQKNAAITEKSQRSFLVESL